MGEGRTLCAAVAHDPRPCAVQAILKDYLKIGTEEQKDSFLALCRYFQGQYDSAEDFARLSETLDEEELKVSSSGKCNRLFYFAIPPKVFVMSAASIKASAMSSCGWTRVVVEKPFGHDAESSKALSVDLAKHLEESGCHRLHPPRTCPVAHGCRLGVLRPDLPH